MPGIEAGTTPTTLVVASPTNDRLVEPDERPAAPDADPSTIAIDDTAKLGGVEDVPGERGVRGDRLDAVDGVGEWKRLAFEVFEQRNAEFHPLGPIEVRESRSGSRLVRWGYHSTSFGVAALRVPARIDVGEHRAVVGICVALLARVAAGVAAAPSATERGEIGLFVVSHVGTSASQRLNVTPGYPVRAHTRRERSLLLCVGDGDLGAMLRSGTRRRMVTGALLAAVAAGALLTSPDAVLARATWLVADPVRLVAAAVVFAAVRPLVAWPTTLLAVLLGYGLGFAGFPFALALVTLTSVPPFLLAHRLGGDGTVAAAGAAFVERAGGVRSVVASRLVPVPSDVVSVAAGVAGVRLPTFLVGTAIGEIPWVLAGTLVGVSAETLTAGSVATVADPRLVVGAGAIAALLLAPTAYDWYLARREATDGVGTDGDP